LDIGVNYTCMTSHMMSCSRVLGEEPWSPFSIVLVCCPCVARVWEANHGRDQAWLLLLIKVYTDNDGK
jgi:hypothetical protein